MDLAADGRRMRRRLLLMMEEQGVALDQLPEEERDLDEAALAEAEREEPVHG